MEDTIAAIATAQGEGGIGIIRISGSMSRDILEKLFVPVSGEIVPRRLTYGHIVYEGQVIDEVMAVFMHGPKTYTCEDTAEINCHGGIISLKRTLDAVVKCGARTAEPGEFTKRAFLNGRLDLSQAEAVIDMISAKTDKNFDVAMKQLDGFYSDNIKRIRKKLVDILVNVTVNIDYPDEDIEEITYSKLSDDISDVKNDIDRLLSSSSSGKILREGLKISIIGKPNVGKSSLMNALLKENRAIVTSIPGTTRDTIEEQLNIRGIPVVLTDTAGIRETSDEIERIGIEKSKLSFNSSDLVIFILDGSRPLDNEDIEILSHIEGKKTIVVVNKSDLDKVLDTDSLGIESENIIYTSAVSGSGIEQIEDVIENMFTGGHINHSESLIVTNARHEELLRKASASLSDAADMTQMNQPLEFIEVDINSCYEQLGEIIGETVSDDIINEVFARFCLGK